MDKKTFDAFYEELGDNTYNYIRFSNFLSGNELSKEFIESNIDELSYIGQRDLDTQRNLTKDALIANLKSKKRQIVPTFWIKSHLDGLTESDIIQILELAGNFKRYRIPELLNIPFLTDVFFRKYETEFDIGSILKNAKNISEEYKNELRQRVSNSNKKSIWKLFSEQLCIKLEEDYGEDIAEDMQRTVMKELEKIDHKPSDSFQVYLEDYYGLILYFDKSISQFTKYVEVYEPHGHKVYDDRIVFHGHESIVTIYPERFDEYEEIHTR